MSTDKKLTCHFRRNCYALHLGASYAQRKSLNFQPAESGFVSCPKEEPFMDKLSDIDEALQHASMTHLVIDELHKKSVDEFIDKLLDERLETVKS